MGLALKKTVKLRAENFFNGVLFFLKFRPQILYVGFYFSQNFPRASRGVLFYIFCCIKTMLFSTVNLQKAYQNTSKFSALRAGSYFPRFFLFKSWVRGFIFSSLIPILFGRGYVDGGVIKANPMVPVVTLIPNKNIALEMVSWKDQWFLVIFKEIFVSFPTPSLGDRLL